MSGKSDRHRVQNGDARAAAAAVGGMVSSLATDGAALTSYDDPMSKVLGLDEKTSGLLAWFGFTSGSTALLVVFMAFATFVAWAHAKHALGESPPDEIDVMREDPPPPPPEPVPETKPEPAPEPPPVVHRAAQETPPPPAPAQAGKVLTSEPDPNDPVDLTGNTIIQGNADSYAGGFTTSKGSNANAVHAQPAATGVPGGTGPVTAKAPAGPDLSHPAKLAGSKDWNCPFPPEAEEAQVNEAYVTLRVEVRVDGSAASVVVLHEDPPSSGFGREARRCAMAREYSATTDHEGHAIAGWTVPVKVHFAR
jgi:protein TonB